ncbi:MAG: hypothetical protein P8179_19340, partial [Candidatus Thiodiazotropha sp.]
MAWVDPLCRSDCNSPGWPFQMVAVLIYSVCLKFKPPDHPMKDITAKAIEDLASATSRYFIPLSHLRAL